MEWSVYLIFSDLVADSSMPGFQGLYHLSVYTKLRVLESLFQSTEFSVKQNFMLLQKKRKEKKKKIKSPPRL